MKVRAKYHVKIDNVWRKPGEVFELAGEPAWDLLKHLIVLDEKKEPVKSAEAEEVKAKVKPVRTKKK